MQRALIAIGIMSYACGPRPRSGDDAPPNAPGADATTTPPVENTPVVYAHSADDLYQIDPETLAVTHVGPFEWPEGTIDSMTDIAIDGHGYMVGVSWTKVYAIDKATAKCTFLSNLEASFQATALSFVIGTTLDNTEYEILATAALDGSFSELDRTTGQRHPIGNYGGNMGSSGDLVSVKSFGTVATVKRPAGTSGTDWLVRVDATTGVATPIGDTGASNIWGLGFWKNKVFGFTDQNEFLLIDPATGHATMQEIGDVRWWGASVTTRAPVIL